ncbi:MAG: hypothetical protein ABSC45_11100 [Desulfobaccales bacterium]|jgi:hypothetical protein
MGFLKKIFGGGTFARPQFEVVENRLCTDLTRFKVRVRRGGQEMYAEDLFQAATKPQDLQFGRFFLLNETPPKVHFAPSLDEAIYWFEGRRLPKDGFPSVFWGEKVSFSCSICRKEGATPIAITKVEQLSVYTNIPIFREILGWRVLEVASDLLGPGIPTKILYMFKTQPIIKWSNPETKFLCRGCARQLTEQGRQAELEGYVTF